jgi:hypothetical protein
MPSHKVEIFIAGDLAAIKHELALQAAADGMCWSVEPTEFIFTGGREVGAVIRKISYARFPSSVADDERMMLALAERLLFNLGQGSCSVVGPHNSYFLTRGPFD